MRPVRVVLAVLGLVVAVLAVVLASDLRTWERTMRDGDLRYTQSPLAARWTASTVLPSSWSRDLLGLSEEIAFRRAARTFVTVSALGEGYDNGYSEGRQRGDLEVTLTNLATSGNAARDSAADNMLGILAFTDSRPTGANTPAPVDRAVGDFTSAVELDPANEYAKFNLEWLLYQLIARGQRAGNSSGTGGNVHGHQGAAGGIPGKGY
jgi:hypothetical protein